MEGKLMLRDFVDLLQMAMKCVAYILIFPDVVMTYATLGGYVHF